MAVRYTEGFPDRYAWILARIDTLALPDFAFKYPSHRGKSARFVRVLEKSDTDAVSR